jgi:hypothetical protein
MTTQSRNTATAKTKAMAAVRVCREGCPTILGVRPFLYKKCLEGVSVFERLRPHVKTTDEPFTFCSLRGQKTAEAFASATLDNVLSVLIDQTPEQKWCYDIVTDVPGLVYGTPQDNPGHETREAAEEAALAGLTMLGKRAVPADDYEPIPNSDHLIDIVLSGARWTVPELPHEGVEELLGKMEFSFSYSTAETTARLADKLVADFDPKNKNDRIALIILANCGWTHVNRTIVDEFYAAHGIDL